MYFAYEIEKLGKERQVEKIGLFIISINIRNNIHKVKSVYCYCLGCLWYAKRVCPQTQNRNRRRKYFTAKFLLTFIYFVCAQHSACVKVIGQFAGVSSLLPPKAQTQVIRPKCLYLPRHLSDTHFIFLIKSNVTKWFLNIWLILMKFTIRVEIKLLTSRKKYYKHREEYSNKYF